MNEKQRWLLRYLDAWQKRERDKIGYYGPHREPQMPSRVRAARRQRARAQSVIDHWEKAKRAPHERARKRIQQRYDTVKRIILFEQTEKALKAIRALK